MDTTLTTLVNEAVYTLKAAQYKESTIAEYRKTFSQLLLLADEMQINCYCMELAEKFRRDSANKWTGQYSHYRWKRRNRCIEMFNWYEEHGYFKLSAFSGSKIGRPSTEHFQTLHSAYLEHLTDDKMQQNTIDSFRNISCKFLQYLEKKQFTTLCNAPVNVLQGFISDLRKTWSEDSLRTALSGLRSLLAFAGSEPHLLMAMRIRALKARKIIPVLTVEDEHAIWSALTDDATISNRDKAITLLGLLAGLRACDIVKMKMSDIDWRTDIISVIQQKTGKPLILPLLPIIGNIIAAYIIKERPKDNSQYIFLSMLAPFKPLVGHSACYKTIQRVFRHAGIDVSASGCGTRLLRHNAASKMLVKGVSIQTISMLLGHKDTDTTDIYLTTDEYRMRECALPLASIPMGLEALK